MNDQIAENSGCVLVAEYVDDSEAGEESQASTGQVVGTRLVASYLDAENPAGAPRDFTILLKDDRVVTVHGHGLRMFPPTVPGTGGSYGVVAQADGEEVLIALFSIPEVVGIFSGEIRPDRKIA
jgi:hypothetical protein